MRSLTQSPWGRTRLFTCWHFAQPAFLQTSSAIVRFHFISFVSLKVSRPTQETMRQCRGNLCFPLALLFVSPEPFSFFHYLQHLTGVVHLFTLTSICKCQLRVRQQTRGLKTVSSLKVASEGKAETREDGQNDGENGSFKYPLHSTIPVTVFLTTAVNFLTVPDHSMSAKNATEKCNKKYVKWNIISCFHLH